MANKTLDYEQRAWELIELARINATVPKEMESILNNIRELSETHGRHSSKVIAAAVAAVAGVALGPPYGIGASEVVYEMEESARTEVPGFFLGRARRLLDPHHTPPDYVDTYCTLAELCPNASHRVLDAAARDLASAGRVSE